MPLKIIRKYPVVKTMASYLCINSAADVTEQIFIKKHTRHNYDVAKTVRIGLAGCLFIGPLIYNWIKFIDRVIPGKRLVHVVCKVACDSFMFAPVGISTFYISTNVLELKTDITSEWKQKFYKTWKAGLLYWPFIQSFNFAFVPRQYKTSVYMPICSFLWCNYMCYMKDQKVIPATSDASQGLQVVEAQMAAKESLSSNQSLTSPSSSGVVEAKSTATSKASQKSPNSSQGVEVNNSKGKRE